MSISENNKLSDDMLGEVIGGVTLGSKDDVGKRVVCSNCYEVFRLTKENEGKDKVICPFCQKEVEMKKKNVGSLLGVKAV